MAALLAGPAVFLLLLAFPIAEPPPDSFVAPVPLSGCPAATKWEIPETCRTPHDGQGIAAQRCDPPSLADADWTVDLLLRLPEHPVDCQYGVSLSEGARPDTRPAVVRGLPAHPHLHCHDFADRIECKLETRPWRIYSLVPTVTRNQQLGTLAPLVLWVSRIRGINARASGIAWLVALCLGATLGLLAIWYLRPFGPFLGPWRRPRAAAVAICGLAGGMLVGTFLGSRPPDFGGYDHFRLEQVLWNIPSWGVMGVVCALGVDPVRRRLGAREWSAGGWLFSGLLLVLLPAVFALIRFLSAEATETFSYSHRNSLALFVATLAVPALWGPTAPEGIHRTRLAMVGWTWLACAVQAALAIGAWEAYAAIEGLPVGYYKPLGPVTVAFGTVCWSLPLAIAVTVGEERPQWAADLIRRAREVTLLPLATSRGEALGRLARELLKAAPQPGAPTHLSRVAGILRTALGQAARDVTWRREVGGALGVDDGTLDQRIEQVKELLVEADERDTGRPYLTIPLLFVDRSDTSGAVGSLACSVVDPSDDTTERRAMPCELDLRIDGVPMFLAPVPADTEVALRRALSALLETPRGRQVLSGRRVRMDVSTPSGQGRWTGRSLELPLVLALACAVTTGPLPQDWAASGSVELDGSIGPVEGLDRKCAAAPPGIRRILVPQAEGLPADLRVVAVARLQEAFARLGLVLEGGDGSGA